MARRWKILFVVGSLGLTSSAVYDMELCLASVIFFFFSSRRRHTRCSRDWSSDCALPILINVPELARNIYHHWQRELQYANTYTDANGNTKCNPYSNSKRDPDTNSQRYTNANT